MLRNGEKRGNKIGQSRRQNKGKTTWKHSHNDRMSSDHSVDGQSTATDSQN